MSSFKRFVTVAKMLLVVLLFSCHVLYLFILTILSITANLYFFPGKKRIFFQRIICYPINDRIFYMR